VKMNLAGAGWRTTPPQGLETKKGRERGERQPAIAYDSYIAISAQEERAKKQEKENEY
jgi:hypothetical protein